MCSHERDNRYPAGLKIILVSFVLGVVGVAPLLLYIAFGPSDGNPIGLGLLAVFAVPAAGIGLLIGVLRLLLDWVRLKMNA